MHPRQCYSKHNPRGCRSDKYSFLVRKASGSHQIPARKPKFKGTIGTAGRDLSTPVNCVDVVPSGSAGIGGSFAAVGGGTEGHRQWGLIPVINTVFFQRRKQVVSSGTYLSVTSFNSYQEDSKKKKKEQKKEKKKEKYH